MTANKLNKTTNILAAVFALGVIVAGIILKWPAQDIIGGVVAIGISFGLAKAGTQPKDKANVIIWQGGSGAGGSAGTSPPSQNGD